MDVKEEKPKQTERCPASLRLVQQLLGPGSDTHHRSISAHVHVNLLPQAEREAAWLC